MINQERINDALLKIGAMFRILRRKAGLTQRAVSKAEKSSSERSISDDKTDCDLCRGNYYSQYIDR